MKALVEDYCFLLKNGWSINSKKQELDEFINCY